MLLKKYGKNQVAQIITYGTMAAKMSIKDVARVMDLPLPESNALAKLVPDRPGIELRRVLQAPITPKDGEKSLIEKEGLGSDDIENVKKLREIYNGKDHARPRSFMKQNVWKALFATPVFMQQESSLHQKILLN